MPVACVWATNRRRGAVEPSCLSSLLLSLPGPSCRGSAAESTAPFRRLRAKKGALPVVKRQRSRTRAGRRYPGAVSTRIEAVPRADEWAWLQRAILVLVRPRDVFLTMRDDTDA